MSDVPPQPPYGSAPPPPPPGGSGYPSPPPQGGGYPPPPGPGQYGGAPPGGYGTPPGYGPPPGAGGYAQPSAGSASQWGTLAEWPQRAAGYLVDWGIGVGGFIILAIVAVIAGQIASVLGVLVYLVAVVGALAWWVFIAIQVGQTGQSPGMRLIGLKAIGKTTGQPIGAGMGIVRALAHFVDSLICYIGWLFPLWDADKQTIADKLLGTVVITVPKQNFSLQPPGGMSL